MSNERVRGSPRPRGLLSEVVVPAEALVGALLLAALVRRLLARALRLGLVVALPDTRLRPLLARPISSPPENWLGPVHLEPVLSKPEARRPVTRWPLTQRPAIQRTWAR